jgi:hypothetical protein
MEVPKILCTACGDLGYWCRGCGGMLKIDALLASGFTEEEAEQIHKYQIAGCEEPYVPCYLCNRSGSHETEEEVWTDFWKGFVLKSKK